jgi:hypothetical protein
LNSVDATPLKQTLLSNNMYIANSIHTLIWTLAAPQLLRATQVQSSIHSLIRRAASAPLLPAQDPFYTPDGVSWLRAKPGTILKQQTIAANGIGNLTGLANIRKAYQLLYRFTDVYENLSYSVPTGLVPFAANPLRHLSYQIANESPRKDCASSYELQYGSSPNADEAQLKLLVFMTSFFNEGCYISVPDYEGPQSAFTSNHRVELEF